MERILKLWTLGRFKALILEGLAAGGTADVETIVRAAGARVVTEFTEAVMLPTGTGKRAGDKR